MVSHSRAIGFGPDSTMAGAAGAAIAVRPLEAPGAERMVSVRAVAPE